MDDFQTFILISREIINWRWFKSESNDNILRMFLYCLVKANFEDCDFQKHKIHRGEFVTSWDSLSEGTGMTVTKCRTAIKHLVETGEIKTRSTNKYTIISIQNYDKYQNYKSYGILSKNPQLTNKQQTNNKQITSKQQANNNQLTTSNTYNTSNTLNALKEKECPSGREAETMESNKKIFTLEEARNL